MSRLEEENKRFLEEIKVEDREGQPVINGIPEGEVVLFFARLNDEEYGVVFGPESCLPKQYPMAELWDAKVAIGIKGLPLKVLRVTHGHKYEEGGGFVEFGEKPVRDRDQIFFRKLDNPKKSTFNGAEIKEVFSAL